MKRMFIAVFAGVVGLGMMMGDAEAKRLGGGTSSGMKRDSTVMKRDAIPPKPTTPPQAAPAPAAAPTAAPAPARSGMSRWLGPIAGLAAGLGIAALLSHFGMGEAAANFMMIALLAFAAIFIIRMIFFRKKESDNNVQYAGVGAGAGNVPFNPQDTMQQHTGYEATHSVGNSSNVGAAPADFDVEGFVRQAKLNFVRLQAANDAGNMDDIREFTTPEMFAEVQMQYQERGKAAQQTDVIQLNADLIDVTTEGTRTIASVRFHGQLRETPNAAPEAFNEVWHLTRPTDASKGWVVAGIQQAE